MLELIAFLIILAFIMEVIDSSLGMMYGTISAPILIGMGFSPLTVIPAILISQAVGGVSGIIFHHKFKNADFNGFTKDTKVAIAMIAPGLLVVGLGVYVAVSIPAFYIKSYIVFLVLFMSVLCLSPLRYKFAWWKHYTVGILAAFNKALSGGGFGPVTSTGGIIGGLSSKVSIATTTYAEVLICSAAFLVWSISNVIDLSFMLPLCLGAFIGGIIGPYLSSKFSHYKLRIAIGILGICSGVWLLWGIMV